MFLMEIRVNIKPNISSKIYITKSSIVVLFFSLYASNTSTYEMRDLYWFVLQTLRKNAFLSEKVEILKSCMKNKVLSFKLLYNDRYMKPNTFIKKET